eukprot:754648-Hanusia_phi.AAC.3
MHTKRTHPSTVDPTNSEIEPPLVLLHPYECYFTPPHPTNTAGSSCVDWTLLPVLLLNTYAEGGPSNPEKLAGIRAGTVPGRRGNSDPVTDPAVRTGRARRRPTVAGSDRTQPGWPVSVTTSQS